MSVAQDLIDEAKRIRQKLRYPPNSVVDPGIDLTRKSTHHKGHEPNPDPPIKRVMEEPVIVEPSYPPMDIRFPITFDNILQAVADHYGVPVAVIKGSCRRAPICMARFVVVYLSLRLLAKRSLSSIARDLKKDHTSILHARNRINAIMASNIQIYGEVSMLEKYIEDNHQLAFPAFGQCRLEIESRPGSPG